MDTPSDEKKVELSLPSLLSAWHTPTLTEWYRDFFSMSRSEQAAFAMSKLSVILAIITVTIDLSPHIFGREHNPARELASEYRKELKHWQTVNSKTLGQCV